MDRRGFLLGAGGILASFAAPAIVRADSLMRVLPIDTTVYLTGTEVLRRQAEVEALEALALVNLTEWFGRSLDGLIHRALVDVNRNVVLHEVTALREMPVLAWPGFDPFSPPGDTIKVKLP